MDFSLIPITEADLHQYKKDLQEAFQKGFEDVFGETDDIILPENDIDASLNKAGAIAYKALIDGAMVGGAVVVIDATTQHNHLDLLFVKYGVQARGIGKAIWDTVENFHPQTRIWETCTPYFDRRNIHFYVNKCGFHIVEFLNEKHPADDIPENFVGDAGQGMFVFQKRMP